MSIKSLSLAAIAAVSCAVPALADTHIMIHDPYARSAGKAAKAGAAFMTIMNHGDEADRLVSVSSDVAARVELHTHQEIGDGVMKMIHVEEGFEIPAEGARMLDRGADHVMFMGLAQPWEQGDILTVTFTFEKAGEMIVEIPVDLDRKATMGHGHSSHGETTGEGDHAHHDH
jgi:copper(I)-binding protein